MTSELLQRRPHLPRVRFQDLRHTHATIMLLNGEHPKVVSERLRRSNVNTTLNSYRHVLPGMQEGATARFETTMRAAFGRPRRRRAVVSPSRSSWIKNGLKSRMKKAPPDVSGAFFMPGS